MMTAVVTIFDTYKKRYQSIRDFSIDELLSNAFALKGSHAGWTSGLATAVSFRHFGAAHSRCPSSPVQHSHTLQIVHRSS